MDESNKSLNLNHKIKIILEERSSDLNLNIEIQHLFKDRYQEDDNLGDELYNLQYKEQTINLKEIDVK